MSMKRNAARQLGVGILTMSLLVTALSPVFGQERGERGQRGERAPRQVDREAMLERMAQQRDRQQERLRQSLQMDEQEFAVVGPMIDQVQSYVRERQMASAFGAMRGGRGDGPRAWGQRGDDGPSFSAEAQAVREAAAALREVIGQESGSADEVQEKLAALRSARSQLDAALGGARESLREVLTPQQEAVLVLQGVLD